MEEEQKLEENQDFTHRQDPNADNKSYEDILNIFNGKKVSISQETKIDPNEKKKSQPSNET